MKLSLVDVKNLNEAMCLMKSMQSKHICSGISDLQKGRAQVTFEGFNEILTALDIEPEMCEYHIHNVRRINEEHIKICFEIDAKWDGFTYFCLASEEQVCKFCPLFEEAALASYRERAKLILAEEEVDD